MTSVNKKILKTIIIIIFILTLGISLRLQSKAASFEINPSTKTFEQACNERIDIFIDATGESSNAGEVIINYDPTKIEILDSNLNIPGLQILEGNAYSTYIYNNVNTSIGEIKLAGFSFIETLQSKRLFGSIEFKSKPLANSAQFLINFTGVGDTFDSNIADSNTSNDILTSVTNATYNFIASTCSGDTTPPSVNFITPTNNQKGVAVDSNVNFSITDDLSGVDLFSLSFLINGEQYIVGDSEVSYSGNDLNYNFVINPNANFYANLTNYITVSGKDKSGNDFVTQIYFNAPDVNQPPPVEPTDFEAPQVNFIFPINLQVGINEDEVISLNITDNLSGINLNSLIFFLNGVQFKFDNEDIEYSGSPLNYEFKIFHDNLILINKINYLRVTGSDNSGNQFDKQIVFNVPQTEGPLPEECEVPNEGGGTDGDSESLCVGSEVDTQEFSQVLTKFLENTKILENTIFRDIIKESGAAGFIALISAVLLAFNLLRFLTLASAPSLIIPAIGFLFGKKLDKPWGIILDSQTKKPVTFAACRLFVADSGYLISQTVADLEGRYGFIVTPGEYRLEIKQSGYIPYEERIVIDQNTSFIKDISLISIESHKEYKRQIFKSFKKWLSSSYVEASKFLYFFGFSISLISVLLIPSLLNVLILILYLGILIFSIIRKISNKPKYASVVNSSNGIKLPFVQVKIFNIETLELVDTVTTNYNGQFDFFGKPGQYAVNVIAQGFKFPSTSNKYRLLDKKYITMVVVDLKNGKNNLELLVDPL